VGDNDCGPLGDVRHDTGGILTVLTVDERFWSKVRKGDGCWVWTACRNWAGYGKFWDGERLTAAHRHSWVVHHGPIPDGLCVLHRCDNPPCINPDHLFLGTYRDNNLDTLGKGRRGYNGAPGERNSHSKLTPAQVYEIRRRGDAGERSSTLASEFGIGWTSTDRIVKRLNWRHLPERDWSATTVLTPGEY
jgi:hypothetical protein